MTFIGTNFSELIAEYVRVEKALADAGYSVSYAICGQRTRTTEGHLIIVNAQSDKVGEEILKLLDFIETLQPAFGIFIAVSVPSMLEPVYAHVPAKK